MYSIVVNSQPTTIGQLLPDTIHSLSVSYDLVFTIQIPKADTPHVKAWFNALIDRLSCDYVSYNGVFIPTSELNKF